MLDGLNVCFRVDSARVEEQTALARLCWYNHHGMPEQADAERRCLENCRQAVRTAEYCLKLYKAWLNS